MGAKTNFVSWEKRGRGGGSLNEGCSSCFDLTLCEHVRGRIAQTGQRCVCSNGNGAAEAERHSMMSGQKSSPSYSKAEAAESGLFFYLFACKQTGERGSLARPQATRERSEKGENMGERTCRPLSPTNPLLRPTPNPFFASPVFRFISKVEEERGSEGRAWRNHADRSGEACVA